MTDVDIDLDDLEPVTLPAPLVAEGYRVDGGTRLGVWVTNGVHRKLVPRTALEAPDLALAPEPQRGARWGS